MRLLFSTAFFVALSMIGCKPNHLEGVYACIKLPLKPGQYETHRDTVYGKNNAPNIVDYIDTRCLIERLDFKGNSTVVVKLANGEMPTSYVIDKDYVRIKGTGQDLLFKMKDIQTLIGEGIFEGEYKKK
ncbi:MAG TPA: hypothetical protein VK498_03755 [Ferruginibacter sp.]|nr:hypothetical protein [Ferruginibacter sp.]